MEERQLNIRVNKKLSLIVLKYISSLSYKNALCIKDITMDKQNRLFEYIIDVLEESIYFKYKEGATKISDILTITSKQNIFDNYSNEVIILNINTLDILWIGGYSGYNGLEEVNAIEVIGSGNFKTIIKLLEDKAYGKLKIIEFDNPIVDRVSRMSYPTVSNHNPSKE